MRQETGSNPISNNKVVSIQVKLGGRSFSADKIAIDQDVTAIECIVDTPRVTLAPRQEVSPNSAEELLHIVGKGCCSNEISICSEPQNDIVAVIAIDEKAYETITEKWGSRVRFSSPLLDMRHCDEDCLTIDMRENVCYIRLFDGGLQRAEAFEVDSTEDVLYYANEWLDEEWDTPIYIKGDKAAAKLLRKYVKEVICE